MGPLVSIIIPAYNRVHLIGETINSIIDQTYQNWECLVIDDSSTDQTEKLLEFYEARDKRIKYLRRPENLMKGANNCRNFGFETSSGNFIKWFDSDDLLKPDAIKIQVEHLELNSDIDASLAYGEYFHEGFHDVMKSPPKLFISEDIVFDYIVGNVHFHTCAPLWRKSFLSKQIFLYDSKLKKLQDVEFHFRMLKAGLVFEMLDQSLFRYRYSNRDRISLIANDAHINSILDYYNSLLISAKCKNPENEKVMRLFVVNKILDNWHRLLGKKIFVVRLKMAFIILTKLKDLIKHSKISIFKYFRIVLGIAIKVLFGNRGRKYFTIKD